MSNSCCQLFLRQGIQNFCRDKQAWPGAADDRDNGKGMFDHARKSDRVAAHEWYARQKAKTSAPAESNDNVASFALTISEVA